jgi:holo-[acyl-carrier protein] synthase
MTPVAVGLDLVDIARIGRMLERKGERALRRLLTPTERDYCLRQPHPARHVAARVAAKEATYKALQGSAAARAIGWREIEVVRDWDGRPAVRLHGGAARRATELGVRETLLSLSHTEEHAAAVTLLLSAES